MRRLIIAPRKAEETLAIWRAAAKGYEAGEPFIPKSPPVDESGIIALSYVIADALKVDHALKVELLEMGSALERLETERSVLSGVAEALKMGPRRSEPAFYGFSLN
ncbi:MAG: hypothetical protein HZB29_09370 [Nitrospinae bacterium]|nr:hypothetical protein [Nitrospinota bacterium]